MSEKLGNNHGEVQEVTDIPHTIGSVPSDEGPTLTHADLSTTEFKKSELGAEFRRAERLAHKANNAYDRANQIQAEIHSEIEKSQAERDKMLADRAKGIETGKLPKAKNLSSTSIAKITKAFLVFENTLNKTEVAMPSRLELENFAEKKDNGVLIDGVTYASTIEEIVIDGKVYKKVVLGERIGESKAGKLAREKREKKAGSVTGKVSIFDRTRESEKSNADRMLGRPWSRIPKEEKWDGEDIIPID
jgi:hypothetical protein